MKHLQVTPVRDENNKHCYYVDKEGKPLEIMPFAITKKPESPYKDGFIMLNPIAMAQFFSSTNVTKASLRVFFAMLGRVKKDNIIDGTSGEIATDVDMRPENCSRCIKQLLELNVIGVHKRVGRVRVFMLNPEFGWRGTLKSLKQWRERNWDEHLNVIKMFSEEKEQMNSCQSNQA